jgi:hypothetical protein
MSIAREQKAEPLSIKSEARAIPRATRPVRSASDLALAGFGDRELDRGA